jgi:uncharacterized protein YjbI with pentapeptide repeats
VIPRAHLPDSDVSLPLERVVLEIVQRNRSGAIFLKGPAGSGKTTALCHLKAVLPAEVRVGLFDEPQYEHWKDAAATIVAVIATQAQLARNRIVSLELSPWGMDDCIEYLSKRHRERCRSVVARLQNDQTLQLLEGSPQLLSMALDEMASDESIATVVEALRKSVKAALPTPQLRETAARYHRWKVRTDGLGRGPAPASPEGWVARNETTLMLAVSEHIVDELVELRVPAIFLTQPEALMISALAGAIVARPEKQEDLRRLLNAIVPGPRFAYAASVLLAVDPDWRPKETKDLYLAGALLERARWSTMCLPGVNISKSLLCGADLSHANLSGAIAPLTDCARANLRQTNLGAANLTSANFESADLSAADLTGAILCSADFQGACLRRACLRAADFHEANLRQADLTQADLSGALLGNVDLTDALFTSADCTNATFTGVDLCLAHWAGTIFRAAKLSECNLEALDLPRADFTQAKLLRCMLTRSRIRGGLFRGADLTNAGLADIDWEGADLRDADFKHASFHMGSSRSGLVGSIIPCEGSKTGFYTDDYTEQDFKAPEEIRKANLRGADLRGARVTDADWYLVDLREAKYDSAQADHFAKCGAILRSRR